MPTAGRLDTAVDCQHRQVARCSLRGGSEAGTETTTAFNAIRADRLEAAVDNYEGNQTGDTGFDLVMILDSNRVPTTEALCWTCRGVGHTKLECPSVNASRTMESVRAMLDAAIDRKNRTGCGGRRGGGKWQPGRGQSAPFRAGGGFGDRRSEPPSRNQPTTYDAKKLDPAPNGRQGAPRATRPHVRRQKKKLLAPLASPLDCAFAGLFGFFAFGSEMRSNFGQRPERDATYANNLCAAA